jgi:hypothetical protein
VDKVGATDVVSTDGDSETVDHATATRLKKSPSLQVWTHVSKCIRLRAGDIDSL